MVLRKMKGFLVAAAVCFGLTAPMVNAAEKLNFIVTDLEGLEEVQREFGPFKQLLEDKTGMTFNFFPVTSRTAAAEALKSKKADFVLTGPAEYVVLRKLTNCEPIIGFSRPDYYSSIIARADSGINTVADLKGKKVAMSDVGSTSGHLGPCQIVQDNGLDPQKDISIVHTSKEIAWESLKKGDVAAWGFNATSFIRFRDSDTSVKPGAFKTIARGPDYPNDVLVSAPHVDKAVVEKVVQAITGNSDALIAEILKGEDNQKYKGMQFVANIKDEDYNYVRSMYKSIGQPQFATFVGE
ncbi:MAG: phosphate/phosphite/phosphonate ABC transporter substrate-binding protein [Desulfobulbaceae bacterium]|nr:phosphate/phosphite/phosphonate ABC transporter substrate-binding protein [Desulfobulbaceae bacterium]